jgi:hypothetical protein
MEGTDKEEVEYIWERTVWAHHIQTGVITRKMVGKLLIPPS